MREGSEGGESGRDYVNLFILFSSSCLRCLSSEFCLVVITRSFLNASCGGVDLAIIFCFEPA